MIKYFSGNEKETIDFGKSLAFQFKGGEIIGLIGDLGSGKTVLTKGIAKGLRIKKNISSPTFIFMRVYSLKGKIKYFCHVDAYRLDDKQALENIGIMDYLGKKDAVTVIEWADKVKKIMPKKSVFIYFKTGKNNEREITIQQP